MSPKHRMRWIDTSREGYWLGQFPQRYTVDEFATELDSVTHAMRALPPGARILYLADFSATVSSDSRNRARVAQFLKECQPELREHVIAWGIVVSGAVLQGAVTAVKWLGGFHVPTDVFRNRRDCELWLEQQQALDRMAANNRKKVGLLG